MRERAYTVCQVNKYIQGLVDNEPFLQDINIKGEVSNLKYHSSGHIYFDIKDESGKISAAMFRRSRRGLSYEMREGDAIVATGDISVYPRNGTYQLIARRIESDGGGDLFARFERLKKELSEMGMFSPEYKKPLPPFVFHVGIVTAPTGAAVQDMIRIITRRNPHARITLYPAIVQGDGAAESVARGIEALNEAGVEAMIVGRGGGSIEDLWAFNEELVARAIFASEAPVVSAVGHETDTTIADFVADVRAATPSEAAELLMANFDEILERLQFYKEGLEEQMEWYHFNAWQRFDNDSEKLRLLHPKEKLISLKERLSSQKDMLNRIAVEKLRQSRHRLQLLAGRLDALSPVKRLSGGYAYLSDEEHKAILSVEEAHINDRLFARLKDGSLLVRVEEIKHE